MRFVNTALGMALIVLIAGCSHNKVRYQPPAKKAPLTMKEILEARPQAVLPIKPKTVQAELVVSISDIKILHGASLRQDNLDRGIPSSAPPQLYVWSTGITKRPNQTVLELEMSGPMPDDIYYEWENDNQIFFWDLSDEIMKQRDIVIRRHIQIESYELLSLIDADRVAPYEGSERNYEFYTKSERYERLTPRIHDQAARIIGHEKNPYLKARLIQGWVNQNMRYQYPPDHRGASSALSSLRGDSGQYADLFVALCRASGVPARMVAGFMSKNGESLSSHIWAEFWLPQYGWIPADATQSMRNFEQLQNPRIVASVGRNIPLKYAPYWATYSNGEVEDSRTGFMQVATFVFSGIKAKLRTRINTLRIDEIEGKLLSADPDQYQ